MSGLTLIHQLQCVPEEFFKPGRIDDLVTALLEPNREIIATTQAIRSEQASEEGDGSINGLDDEVPEEAGDAE